MRCISLISLLFCFVVPILPFRFREREHGMKTVWIASIAIAASGSALAQSTIYKHVDESGRITYTNRPMKGAVQMDLEPLTTIPGTPAGRLTQARAAPASEKA